MELKEIKKLLEKYSKEEVEFGKLENFILDRVNATKEEIIEDLFNFDNLEVVEKQETKGEIRYVLFYVYSKKKGRVYVITLREKIRIITAYPLGRKTLAKYRKNRFINIGR